MSPPPASCPKLAGLRLCVFLLVNAVAVPASHYLVPRPSKVCEGVRLAAFPRLRAHHLWPESGSLNVDAIDRAVAGMQRPFFFFLVF